MCVSDFLFQRLILIKILMIFKFEHLNVHYNTQPSVYVRSVAPKPQIFCFVPPLSVQYFLFFGILVQGCGVQFI